MARSFDRDELLSAFDDVGRAAVENGVVLHIAVYGGSALMLASNFRFSSEDVDIAELDQPWPRWLSHTVKRISKERGWAEDWINDAVSVHLSALATLAGDHVEFGTFPRSDAEAGLVVYVPSAEYLLALKLKAARLLDPVRGDREQRDIRNLMRVTGISTAEDAVAVMARFFPRSAADPAKQLFLLRHVLASDGGTDASRYPVAGV